MKASLKFRDEQKPLFRAKVPLNLLKLPFQYGVSAGDSKEFSLNLSTFFQSGPSLKLVYRPNDSWNPFSLIFKTGIGSFASPIASPLSISAEFNLLDRRRNPTFFLKFKPEFGDFSIKKSLRSPTALQTQSKGTVRPIGSPERDLDSETDGSFCRGETSGHRREHSGFMKLNWLSTGSGAGNTIDGLLNNVELSVRTVLPVRHRHFLKFRWGVRFPTERESIIMEDVIGNRTTKISFRKIPFLVMNKISIEHVAEESKTNTTMFEAAKILPVNTDVADANSLVEYRRESQWTESEIDLGKSDNVTGSQISG